MKTFSRNSLVSLMTDNSFPCLSFYLPTQKAGAETRQSSKKLKNLTKKAEHQLRESGIRHVDVQSLLQPVLDMIDDAILWEHQEAGLALFVSKSGMISYHLPVSTEESFTLADRFRIRPLIPLVNGNGLFFVLALSLKDAHLYDCTRDSIEPRAVSDFPDSLKEILETYEGEKQLQHHSASGGQGAVFHGFNDFKDSEKDRIVEYLRQIDTVVTHSLAIDHTPLVVACVDYLYPLYKSISRYSSLLDRHVSGSPDNLQPKQIHAKAWELVRPVFEQRQQQAMESMQSLTGTPRLSEGITHILPAAAHGRVESLFLDNSETSYGRLDPDTEAVIVVADGEPVREDLDLFDLAADYVIRQGGAVYLVQSDALPPGISCQAVLRY